MKRCPQCNRVESDEGLKFCRVDGVFKTRMLSWIHNFHEFDVSPDGQRFLIGTLIGDTKAAPPTVILNWTAELKK